MITTRVFQRIIAHAHYCMRYSIMEILTATGHDVDDQLLLVSCTHIQNHVDAVAPSHSVSAEM